MTPEHEPRLEVAESQLAGVVPVVTSREVQMIPTPAVELEEEETASEDDEEYDDERGLQAHFMGRSEIQVGQVTPRKPRKPVVPSSYTPRMAGVGRVGSPVAVGGEEPESPTRKMLWKKKDVVMGPLKPPGPSGEEEDIRRFSLPPSSPPRNGSPDTITGPDSPHPILRYPKDRIIPSSQWYENDTQASLSTQMTRSDTGLSQPDLLTRTKSVASMVSVQSDGDDLPPPAPPRRFSSNITIANSFGSSSSALDLSPTGTPRLRRSTSSLVQGDMDDKEQDVLLTPLELNPAEKQVPHDEHDPLEDWIQAANQAYTHFTDPEHIDRASSPGDPDAAFSFHPIRTQRFPMEGFLSSQAPTQTEPPLHPETQNVVKMELVSQVGTVPQLQGLGTQAIVKAEPFSQLGPVSQDMGSVHIKPDPEPLEDQSQQRDDPPITNGIPHSSPHHHHLRAPFLPPYDTGETTPDTSDAEIESPLPQSPKPLPGPHLSQLQDNEPLPSTQDASLTVSQLLPNNLMETFPVPPDEWAQTQMYSQMSQLRAYEAEETQD
ncbi:hypothetical protein EX30DRAFT_337728 [Ascodesmis nigricans]|uniref:Uncharacterized protein n=1 Tax=Ascodesmis nigricans TaxID=341454 RepID=A0A4S2N7X0_9PEZI|nr:hypothetical protein EX30DRAFT_337728 [Ascodesmis nigricans]